jgi:cytochrome c1
VEGVRVPMRVRMLGLAAAVALAGCAAGPEDGQQPLAGARAAASPPQPAPPQPPASPPPQPASWHQPKKGTAADNSRCFVCHVNYEDEEMTVKHARGGIGCATCHGPSDAHCGDEGNVTPPDILFPPPAVVPSCLKCHAGETLADADYYCPVWLAGETEKTCLECHGAHRMSVRTVHWDRETRQLLPKEPPKR